MDVTTRNFFRLLRAGVFGQQEMVEPMSACKWRKTMRFAEAHGVETEAYAGLEVLREQFFVQMIPTSVWSEWAARADGALLRHQSDKPVLSRGLIRQLADIARKTDASQPAYLLLEETVRLAYALLRDDHWVRQLMVTGELIREKGAGVDREHLRQWVGRLRLSRMLQLEGALLVELMGVQASELPFEVLPSRFDIQRFASAIPHSQEQLRFSQGKDIFVHTSNRKAMVWNARRSARFFRYYPTGSIANLIASFASSLTHIEE